MIPQTDEVNDLVHELGQFYQLVDIRTGEPITVSDRAPASTTTDESEWSTTQTDIAAHTNPATGGAPDILPLPPSENTTSESNDVLLECAITLNVKLVIYAAAYH